MFKRNGQPCQHAVPDYPARLTDAEFLAYNSVFAAVENDFKELSALATALRNLEQSLPQITAGFVSQDNAPEQIEARNGSRWEVLASLMKSPRSEMLCCKRHAADMDEFAIVHRFDVNSPIAKARGTCDLQMTSNDAQALLRDFIEAQRETLGLFAIDIVAGAHEIAGEKYSGQDMDRVVKAVEARCAKQVSGEIATPRVQSQTRGEGMHV